MENFTIITRLTAKKYAKTMFLGLYRKPVFILATVLGFYFAMTTFLDFVGLIDFYSGIPVFEILCGGFLLLSPTFIVLIAVRQFTSNPSFEKEISYTFTENGVGIQGPTWKSEFLWAHIIKQKEIGDFLVLYHNNTLGNFINKTKMAPHQLHFIKSRINKK